MRYCRQRYFIISEQVLYLCILVDLRNWSLIPKLGNANFKGTLLTFKHQLTLKISARCGISIVLL